MTGSARPERRNPPPPSSRKTGKALPVLLSCCLFLAIACGCLLAALVLVGKHFVYNAIAISHRSDLEIKVKRPLARLSNDTEPIHYDLTLMPDLETGRFQGKVNITIVLKNTKENITLHSKNLHIETVELKFREHPALLAVQNIEENIVDETLTVVPKEKLFSGTYFLYFEFSGSLVKKLTGLYRSQYRRRDTNETRAMATSKFEPTYARQAFPCFDEPNKKAKYTVHLVKPKDPTYQALSNMPVASEETTPNGDILVHFEPSVKMSTYLTCFIVSDFKYTEDKIAPNVPFRVFATPEQIEKTNYAREVGKKVMEYYTKYFGIPYPLPKLDMAAIPDFVSGAMEHWGLVTYRETALLYTNKTHSSSNKQRVATVVAHELAHSWFGNLVTMDWWNDLWLNEGFASYIQYKGTDSAEPDWQMLDQFLISTLHSILSLDSTLGSHPIVQSVLTPDEITSIFDAVSYNKGASILRMLEDAVGEKNFQQSITNYLNAHKFENAVTQDLLNEIQEIVDNNINVTEFVSTWTVQMGYPVINVKTQGKEYVLTQKQFLKDPDNEGKAPPSPYNYKWTIPITYITSENSSPQYVWFNHSNTKVTIPKPQNVKWIKFNYKQVGYYRINYEEEDWQILSENIKHLSNADKTHLLEETFSLAEAGQLSYHIALNLTKYLSSESNYIPWSVASSVFEHLKMIMSNSKYLADLKKYVVDLVTPAFNNLTWESKPDENHLTRLARVTVLDLACSMGHVQCLKDAGKQFTNYLHNNSELSQDLRGLIYSYGMSYGSQEDWDKLFQIFVAENDANEKLKMLNGLASIKDAGTLRQLIDLAKDETYIRSQDYFSCLKFISDNPIGTSIVWDYVRENWEFLVERFGLNDRYLGQLIPAITRTFSTNTKLEEMQAFFIKYPNAGAGATSRSQALETVQNNIKWLARYKESVEDWIKNSSN